MVAILLLVMSSATLAAAEDGKDLYDSYCQNCHGIDKAALTGYTGSIEDFTMRLSGETDDMPDFADFFEPEEVSALYDYLMLEAE